MSLTHENKSYEKEGEERGPERVLVLAFRTWVHENKHEKIMPRNEESPFLTFTHRQMAIARTNAIKRKDKTRESSSSSRSLLSCVVALQRDKRCAVVLVCRSSRGPCVRPLCFASFQWVTGYAFPNACVSPAHEISSLLPRSLLRADVINCMCTFLI